MQQARRSRLKPPRNWATLAPTLWSEGELWLVLAISRRAHAEHVCPRNGEIIHYPRFGCDLKRLHDTLIAIRYQDGMIDDAAYERERDAIRAKLTTASTSLPFADL